jgi:plasmid stabilization system protein ParE
MPALRWLPAALNDLERLLGFIREKNPQAAARAAAAILDGADLLLTTPRLGRPMPDETGRRELLVPFGGGGYILRYRLESDDTVVILRVCHSREVRR